MTDVHAQTSYSGQERLQGGMGRTTQEGSTFDGSEAEHPKGGFFEGAEQVMLTVSSQATDGVFLVFPPFNPC